MEQTKIINSFPGYEYVRLEDGKFHNMYRGTDIGFGGYIISNPGIYVNVALLDIASLHPNSIRAMNCFGEYTKNFTDILDARIAIKHKDFDAAREMMDGRLIPFLKDESTAKDLAQALKIAINSVYGLTAASFNNPFRDSRNANNIVALRGALFMRTLQDEVESRGYQIVAIKTDSIKIANATKDIIDFCMEFAAKYGYTFEHEASYSRMCQINDADYIAKYRDPESCAEAYGYTPKDNFEHAGEWTATGAQFQVPYVFKKLFSKESIEFADMCEAKEVKTALYLDMNEGLEDVSVFETLQALRRTEKGNFTKKENALLEHFKDVTDEELADMIAVGHDYRFIGRVGQFCPVKPGCGGGELLRIGVDKNGYATYSAATGSKGYKWLESEFVRENGMEEYIDRSYYDKLVDAAVDTISEYGDFEWFTSDDSDFTEQYMNPPWKMACGKDSCHTCPHLINGRFDGGCALGHDNSDFLAASVEAI